MRPRAYRNAARATAPAAAIVAALLAGTPWSAALAQTDDLAPDLRVGSKLALDDGDPPGAVDADKVGSPDPRDDELVRHCDGVVARQKGRRTHHEVLQGSLVLKRRPSRFLPVATRPPKQYRYTQLLLRRQWSALVIPTGTAGDTTRPPFGWFTSPVGRSYTVSAPFGSSLYPVRAKKAANW